MERDYIALRNKYLPKKLKAVFVLESPPQGHGYVYDSAGRTSEVLFRAFMKFIGFTPSNKEEGLRKLAELGYLLVNPIYIPINKLSDKEADAIILKNYQNFITDLETLKINKTTPIILVKSNILRLLEQPLLSDGYNVINRGLLIPFPLHYHIETFLKRLRLVFKNLS